MPQTEDVTIPDVEAGDSPGRVARWVLMLSHLYYDRGVSLVDDATYDELCAQAADQFEELVEHLQQQIEDPEVLRSTGMGVFLSQMTVAAAERLALDLGHDALPPYKFKAKFICGCCDARLAPIRG